MLHGSRPHVNTTCADIRVLTSGLRSQAAFRATSHLGGKLLLFTAAAATVGAFKTKNREAANMYGTYREPALRQPADQFFRKFAGECINQQICVDIFALAGQYVDLFSLLVLPRSTGGALFHYPGFNAARDGSKLAAEVRGALLRTAGWEAVLRLRCSRGMRVSTFHGHLHVRSNDLVVLPAVDADCTFVAQLQHEENVLSCDAVFVQCALLYTAPSSERRIRVHTMRLPVVSTAAQLFEHADAVGCASTLAKLGVDKALAARLDETRTVLQQRLMSQLQEFKSVVGSQLRGGAGAAALAYARQLRHLLPWVHGTLRGAAFRGGAEVPPDERAAALAFLAVRACNARAILNVSLVCAAACTPRLFSCPLSEPATTSLSRACPAMPCVLLARLPFLATHAHCNRCSLHTTTSSYLQPLISSAPADGACGRVCPRGISCSL